MGQSVSPVHRWRTVEAYGSQNKLYIFADPLENETISPDNPDVIWYGTCMY